MILDSVCAEDCLTLIVHDQKKDDLPVENSSSFFV